MPTMTFRKLKIKNGYLAKRRIVERIKGKLLGELLRELCPAPNLMIDKKYINGKLTCMCTNKINILIHKSVLSSLRKCS